MSEGYTSDSMVHDRDSALQAVAAADQCLQDLKRMMLNGEVPGCKAAFAVADAIASLNTTMAWLKGCSTDSQPGAATEEDGADGNAPASSPGVCGVQPTASAEGVTVMPISDDEGTVRVADSVFRSEVL